MARQQPQATSTSLVVHDEFFPNLNHLKKLWLDGNKFSGPNPASLAEAEALIKLHLKRNQFSGELRPTPPPALKSFNVSNDDLDGVVPEAFRAGVVASSRSDREQGIRSTTRG